MLTDTPMNNDTALVPTTNINKNIETKYFIDDCLHGIWNDILKFTSLKKLRIVF